VALTKANIKKNKEIELPAISDICGVTADLPLTTERKRLLAALMLPQTATMSHIDICTYANIHPNTYYNAIKDPEFNALQVKVGRTSIQGNALKHIAKYDEVAMGGDRQALERLMEQQGTLDPVQRNINVQGAIVNTSIGELLALIKEEKIDSEDIGDLVDVLESEKVEGSAPDEAEGSGIPQENIGPSLSEKNNNMSTCDEFDVPGLSEKITNEDSD
jgi:hypothetical protein